MKWTTMQLNRYINVDLLIEDSLDLLRFVEKDSDITRMDECFVQGKMSITDEKYIFDLTIKTTLYMPCAITLEEVRVEICENITEIFSNDEDDNKIDGITIDLDYVIWLNILAHKPMRVVKDGAISPFETTKKQDINPAFKDLLKFL